MSLADLGSYLNDDALTTPALISKKYPEGKVYRIPSPDALTGLWLESLADIGVKAASGVALTEADASSVELDDDDERSVYQRVLGEAYDEMLDDGISYVALGKIGQYAFIFFTVGKEAADASIAMATLPNRKARRAAAKPRKGSPRASSAVARKTRSQGFTDGTTHLKAAPDQEQVG